MLLYDNYIDDFCSTQYKAFSYICDKKIVHSLEEYVDVLNLEKLADVLEVLVGLASHLGYTEVELFAKRKQKKEERGGFNEGVVLERVWE
ncbi:hypothetical protein [Clostridium sp.]|uniref:hypothetical protein n=1 Tax=Clostridium sp. TaxID=1506 RepID=UPI003D6C9322